MWGLLIGAVCGGIELYLLYRLLRAVTGGRIGSVILLLLLKLAVLACAFAPVILFLRNDLLWCGVGVASVLTVGSIVIFIKNEFMKGGNKN